RAGRRLFFPSKDIRFPAAAAGRPELEGVVGALPFVVVVVHEIEDPAFALALGFSTLVLSFQLGCVFVASSALTRLVAIVLAITRLLRLLLRSGRDFYAAPNVDIVVFDRT